jgi:hypothetical protein
MNWRFAYGKGGKKSKKDINHQSCYGMASSLELVIALIINKKGKEQILDGIRNLFTVSWMPLAPAAATVLESMSV